MTLQTSSTIQSFETQELETLRARISGQVITPKDAGYDTARQTSNLTVNQHPALIVVVETSRDVAEAIRLADKHDLGVAVKAGGHGTIREADGGVLIVTSQMTDVIVNATAKTAWISAGAKWGRVLEQTQPGGNLRIMTIRSEGQFNTVVYDGEDVYRGVDGRDIVHVSPEDAARLGLREGERVVLVSETGRYGPVRVHRADIRPGNIAAYYPEANVLVPRRIDPRSKTPAFKSVSVRIESAASGAASASAEAFRAEAST